MTLDDFDALVRSRLALDELSSIDASLNGIQVASRRPDIRSVATAVDASLETFRRASDSGADLLFVHHGLFWGRELALRDLHYERIRALIEADIALYAVHLPLDQHPELGNNAGMVHALGLSRIEPFGTYHGSPIGFRGHFEQPIAREELIARLFGDAEKTLGVLPFGPADVSSVGVVSGGAPRSVDEAIDLGLDLFITGDASHEIYHRSKEAGINVIFGGHYATEVWGPRLVADWLNSIDGLDAAFIDVPTGL